MVMTNVDENDDICAYDLRILYYSELAYTRIPSKQYGEELRNVLFEKTKCVSGWSEALTTVF